MDTSVEHTRSEFNTVRTGPGVGGAARPDPDRLLRHADAAQAARDDQRARAALLTIQPFDPSSIKAIEKAIQESDLGLTPSNDGKLIRLPIPQLTEERRKELVKVVRHIAEEGRVAVRNVRRDVMHHLKELVGNGDVGDDEERRAEDQVQKLTDEHTKRSTSS